MSNMFNGAAAFNGDISKWDVSEVTDMSYMFWLAKSFNQRLCQPPWVKSKANKLEMFTGSSGSIWRRLCRTTFPSRDALERAVVACLKLSPKGDCRKGLHGSIGEWDVAAVADMDKIFNEASSFNGPRLQWPPPPQGCSTAGGPLGSRGTPRSRFRMGF